MLTSPQSAWDLQKTVTNLRQDDVDIQFPFANSVQKTFQKVSRTIYTNYHRSFELDNSVPESYLEELFYIENFTSLVRQLHSLMGYITRDLKPPRFFAKPCTIDPQVGSPRQFLPRRSGQLATFHCCTQKTSEGLNFPYVSKYFDLEDGELNTMYQGLHLLSSQILDEIHRLTNYHFFRRNLGS